jgi:osmotically-inducible protein OsmY
MNSSVTKLIAVAFGLACSSVASAQSLSKGEYNSARADIAAEYKSARAACAPMAGTAKENCVAEAKSKRKAARAELAARQSGAPVAKKESPQEYVDDSVITAKVKAAVLEEPSLKSAEINVETYKGIVQLSGFVRSRANIDRAVQVARGVKGVASVKNVMIIKGQQ